MYRNVFQQLLITALFSVGALQWSNLVKADSSGQRKALREVSLQAATDANRELDRARAVLDAALKAEDATKWSATPADLSALLAEVGKGLTLPPLPSTNVAEEDLPSDAAEARKTISSLVLDLASRLQQILVLSNEPIFGSNILEKLNSADGGLSDLGSIFEKLGNKLATPYAEILGYSDVDQLLSKNTPVIAELRVRAQGHAAASVAAVKDLRESSRPLLSTASNLLQKESKRLSDEKGALEDLTASLAVDAKKIQSDNDNITRAIEKNSSDANALLTKVRDLEALAVAAAKKVQETGSESDRDAAKASRQELDTFQQGLAAALKGLSNEKAANLVLREKNLAARDQLQKTAVVALARYKLFESQQTGHDADASTIKGISF